MGKSLKGKELGKGIRQKKDGGYEARYVDRFGQRKSLYARKYQELLNKLNELQYLDFHDLSTIDSDITLNSWYELWKTTFKNNIKDTSIVEYNTRFNRISKDLGNIKLKDLNLLVIQNTFNNLSNDTQRKTAKILLVAMLDDAVSSEIIMKNVAKNINTVIDKTEPKIVEAFTVQESLLFLDYSSQTWYSNLFVLSLETGMRIGEMLSLTWDDVDFDNKTISVNKTLCYVKGADGKYKFTIHTPKTKSGVRVIPLTQKAYDCLKDQECVKNMMLKKGYKYNDDFENLVFFTQTMQPSMHSLINRCIRTVTGRLRKDGYEFEDFGIHKLRHSFATRCIENGMNPKTLQKILGHANIDMTMNRYCHVTNDTLKDEMSLFEKWGENGEKSPKTNILKFKMA